MALSPWGQPIYPPMPRPPSVFGQRWPGPSGAAGRIVIGGALLTGLAVAVSVPLDRPGVGGVLAGLVLAACVAVAARAAGSKVDLPRIGWALATVLLLGAGALRAADWLFALCVLTAAVTGSLALAGGRSLLGMVAGAVAWPFASLRSLPWATRGARSFGDREVRAGLAVVVTVVLLLIFGALFASADAAFDRVLSAVLPDLDAATVVQRVFLFGVGVLALLGAAFLISRAPDLSGLERPGGGRLRPFEWGLPLVALDLLFAAFVAVQFTVLFGGRAHVLGEGGPNFAEYARSGFGQLLLVTLLTLAVLGGAARWARREGRRDRILIRALLGALAALAMVVVASALYRMFVYEEAYGFTQLRVLVSAFELWLGVVFLLILGAGVKLRATWLPHAVVGTAVAALLGLVALNPDEFIADRNVDRYHEIDRIDLGYLSSLSADAAPALDRLPADLRNCALHQIAFDLEDSPDDWHEANLGRWRARDLLAGSPVPAGTINCPTTLRW
jgi:hypothetical protein